MKKHGFAALLMLCLFFGTAAHAQWTDKLTLYLPNRILDVLDVFTLNIGGGPTLHAELCATHALKVGGGIFYTAKLMKDWNRQYGFSLQNGTAAYLPGYMAEDTERRPASWLVPEFWLMYTGIPKPDQQIFDRKQIGARDFWEFGGSLGILLVDVDVSLHPTELLDALLGFFFIDINEDDLTFEHFQK